jgi:hypothetical protein
LKTLSSWTVPNVYHLGSPQKLDSPVELSGEASNYEPVPSKE